MSLISLMFSRARLAFAGLFWGFAALLLAAPAPVLAGGEQLVNGQGLLWRVDGGGAPSYLFGTMHSADEEVTSLAPSVAEAFAGADSLTLEVLLTPETQMRLALAMALTDGRSLEGIVGPELFARAVAAGQPYGLGAPQLQIFKPWAVMTLLSLPPAELKRQAAGLVPLDKKLEAKATERGMPLHALESIEEQVGVFNTLSEADQVAMLAAAIDQGDQIDETFELLRQAYLAGDTQAIYALMRSQQAGFDPAIMQAFTEQLIDSRNDRMAERMQERLEEGNAFIAVGALHLPGERGILKQLEDQGYSVTRVY